jgi:hypothetical protein
MMKAHSPFGRSTSRMTLFHHCNKKYFFQYYTNYLKDISPDIRLDTLLLKNLTSFKMRLGEKTHHIIADYLRFLLSLSSNQSVIPTGQDLGYNALDSSLNSEWLINLKSSMRTTMEQEFHTAKSRQYKRYDKDQKFGFKEFCYGDDITDQLQEGIDRVLWNLDAFIASPLHETIVGYFNAWYKAYIESNESDFEQMKLVLDHHPVLQDVTIWAGPDFGITGTDNTYYIYDRKSWTEKDIPQDVITDQLKVYAYKLLCNTGKTLDNTKIYAYEVYLPSMYMIGGKVSQADIDHIKDKIVDDVHELQALVVNGNIKANHPQHVDNFLRTTDSHKCQMCSMRRVCAGLKKIDTDNTPNPILDALAEKFDSGRLF